MKFHTNVLARGSLALAVATVATGLSACTLSEVSYVPRSDPVYQAQPYPVSQAYTYDSSLSGSAQPNYYAPQTGYAPQPAYVPQQGDYGTPVTQIDSRQIADLTASIALYPDPLLAVMLPAATYPDEIIAANQWLQRNPYADDATIDSLDFEPSVRALMHYPTVLQMMAEHADWTQALGAAFAYQSSDVFNSIQQWRATAEASGALAPTPQQQVVQAGPLIQILPATPDVIYVPEYDPSIVFLPGYHRDRDYIHYRIGGRSSRWLDDDMDWRNRVVRVPERHDWDRRVNQRDYRDNRQPVVTRQDNTRDYRDSRDRNSVVQQPRVVTPAPEVRRDKDMRAARPVAPAPAPAPIVRAPAPAPQPSKGPVSHGAPIAGAIRTPTPAPTADNAQRNAFVRNAAKPNVKFPEKAVLPQPDKKVVTVTPPAGRGTPPTNANVARGRQNGPEDGKNDRGENGRGRADNR